MQPGLGLAIRTPSFQSAINAQTAGKKLHIFLWQLLKKMFIFWKNEIQKKILYTTYFFVLLLSLSSKRMLGGGRGGGGGGGTTGDLLAWEVLMFPFKPGEWGAVEVTGVPTWFSEKKKDK